MPHLLYIGQTPSEGTGSPVIVLRHLRGLTEAGWRITLILESGQDASACQRPDWQVMALPLRRAWWPPLRQWLGFTRSLRAWLLARECKHLLGAQRPDAVLGYLAAHDDFFPEIAARYARLSRSPLSLLVHDEGAAFLRRPTDRARLHRRHAWILRQAHRCWFVSPELAIAYGSEPSPDCVLLPIPSIPTLQASWQPTFSQEPRVYYAGSLWPAQLPLLGTIATILSEAGARLVLLTQPSPALTEFLRSKPAAHVPPFPTNAEALLHLARNAAGVIVSYSANISEMPWIATSFPSKLIEYVQLGLPCAIVAPPCSAVGRWARGARFKNFFRPEEAAGLKAWANDLRSEKSWRVRSEPSSHLAVGEFSRTQIQTTFANGLLRP